MNRKEKVGSQGAGCVTNCQCTTMTYPEPLFKHGVTVVVWIVNTEPCSAAHTSAKDSLKEIQLVNSL